MIKKNNVMLVLGFFILSCQNVSPVTISNKNSGSYKFVFDMKFKSPDMDSAREQANQAFSVPEGFHLLTQRDENTAVRYGDYIRIMHQDSNYYLHTHNIPYFHDDSSEQQQVTCYSNKDYGMTDSWAAWWQITGPSGSDDDALHGQFIDPTKPIRLRAQSPKTPETDENYVKGITRLHSHDIKVYGHPSPVREEEIETEQGTLKQEVSCCPDDNKEDNWLLMRSKDEDDQKKQFKLGSGFSLKHVASGRFLRSKPDIVFNVREKRPAPNNFDNQQEVCCVQEEEHPLTTWRVALVAREDSSSDK